MKQLLLILALPVILIAGCDKTGTEPTKPVEIVLNHYKLLLLSENLWVGGTEEKVVLYSDITPGGCNDTIRIMQGNGGYKVVKMSEINSDLLPKVDTEAKVVGDSIVVVSMKADIPKYTEPDEVYFACSDVYLLTDSENKERHIVVTSLAW